ncbi:MAG TPA: alpha/beta fold hydrolase [Gemmata sp.]|nr:alpha/beta fold hydrolase [Gemmata sp.]
MTIPHTEPVPSRKHLGRWRRRVQIAAILAIGLWLFGSWLVADQMIQRAAPIRAESPPVIAWGEIRPLRLSTVDAEELGGWYIPGEKSSPTVLLLHGNGGTRGDCLDQAEWLAKAGYPLLLITLRAHGDSTGDLNDIGFSARHDVIAAVAWLEKNGHSRPIVWGRSLGSAAAMFASNELGNRVSGYVLECPYRDLRTAVHNRIDNHLPPPLSWLAYAGLSLTAPLVLGDVERISPRDASAGVPKNVPVLLLAGGNDRLARPEEAESIAAQIGPRAQVIIFDGAGHLELHRTDPNRYRQIGLRFLASCGAAD